MMENKPTALPSQDIEQEDIRKEKPWAIDALSFLAWIDLLASLICAFWILTKFGHDDLMFAVGVGVLFQGLLGSIFFLVVVSMADNLVAIRKVIETKKD